MAYARINSAHASNTDSNENKKVVRIKSSVAHFPTTTTNKLSEFCFWLNETPSSSTNFLVQQGYVRRAITGLQLFDSSDKCEDAIIRNSSAKIILVVTSSFAEKIVSKLHDLTQLKSFYILAFDFSSDSSWLNKYSKINGSFKQATELVSTLRSIGFIESHTEECGSISIVTSTNDNLEARTASSMWFQLYIEVILRMHHKSSTRQEMVNACKIRYEHNSVELNVINEFEKSYKPEDAIWWYTRECFLYRILNKSLRFQDFDMLFSLRFFLTDLSKQLIHEHERYYRSLPSKDQIQVYRGQAINVDELKLLQTNIGRLLSMNSFLSTSRQRVTALGFLNLIESSKEVERILFEINIDPCEKTKPFCSIDHLSFCRGEDEFLIMIGASFRILSIQKNTDLNVWIAQLNMTSEDDFELQETFRHMKTKIGEDTNLHSLGKILTEMGQYKQAQKCFQRMINEAKFDQILAYSGLGWADHWLNDYDQALTNLKTSLALIEDGTIDMVEEKARLHSCIGLVYWRKKQYEQALLHLQKALTMQKEILSPQHIDLLATYNRLAITYSALNQTDLALEYYNTCLNIRLEILPHDHPDIATSYNNIGWLMTEKLSNHKQALECFTKSLLICRKVLPATHRDIKRTEQNIRKLQEKLNQPSEN